MKHSISKSLIGMIVFVWLIQSCTNHANHQSSTETSITNTENNTPELDHYTFELSDLVQREKVTYKNRYGFTIAANLYYPKNIGKDSLPGLVIGGPFGAVKEQASGLYAAKLAARGFVTLAFDPSFTGESSGEPRNNASPDIFTEDMSAGVDFLGLQNKVDRTKIGMIGVCGSGGFALNAAAVDKRVKAVATAAMYDISRGSAKGLYDSMTAEARTHILEMIGEQRWKDMKSGKAYVRGRHIPDELTEDTDPITKEFWGYYKTERGYHKNAVNSNDSWISTMSVSFMNMPQLTYIKEIAPRPILIISGEEAHSRYFSEDAFAMASEPKELLLIPNANHVDLYDGGDHNYIPFDRLEQFFKQNLK